MCETRSSRSSRSSHSYTAVILWRDYDETLLLSFSFCFFFPRITKAYPHHITSPSQIHNSQFNQCMSNAECWYSYSIKYIYTTYVPRGGEIRVVTGSTRLRCYPVTVPSLSGFQSGLTTTTTTDTSSTIYIPDYLGRDDQQKSSEQPLITPTFFTFTQVNCLKLCLYGHTKQGPYMSSSNDHHGSARGKLFSAWFGVYSIGRIWSHYHWAYNPPTAPSSCTAEKNARLTSLVSKQHSTGQAWGWCESPPIFLQRKQETF